MIVVKISPNELTPCGQRQKRQTHLQITLSKLLIQPLLSKNRKRDTLAFTSRQDLNNVAYFSSKKEIIATHKTDQKREIHPQTP